MEARNDPRPDAEGPIGCRSTGERIDERRRSSANGWATAVAFPAELRFGVLKKFGESSLDDARGALVTAVAVVAVEPDPVVASGNGISPSGTSAPQADDRRLLKSSKLDFLSLLERIGRSAVSGVASNATLRGALNKVDRGGDPAWLPRMPVPAVRGSENLSEIGWVDQLVDLQSQFVAC